MSTYVTGSGKKAKRASKKRLRTQEEEEEEDASHAEEALSLVNVKHYIDGFSNKSDQIYFAQIKTKLRELFPQTYDGLVDTELHWINSIQKINELYPPFLSTSKCINYEKSDNNINKFFGNKFGSVLRNFMQNIARHYTGMYSYVRVCLIYDNTL